MRTTLMIILCLPALAGAQSIIQGRVMDADSKSPIIFGTVALMQDGKIIKGVETDMDGQYIFEDVPTGIYYIEASYIGYKPNKETQVVIISNQIIELNILINEGVSNTSLNFTCWRYAVPLINFDNMGSGATFISEDIRNMALPR